MIRHNIKVFILTLFCLVSTVNVYSAIPAGYYTRLEGKAKADLKTALFEIINPHTEVSSYSALPTYFQKTDLYPQSTRWWDMYSDIPFYAPSFKGLNREHSFPKSWWGGDTDIPAYVDLNHLYPAESDANMAKNNYPLGVVTGTPKFDNGLSLVGRGINSGGASYVFEPADEYKGDFARTYFYMVTCYQNLTWKYQYMARNGTYPTLQSWAIDLLLDWHRKDPVSQKELDRNEAVYKIQSNRNPFIDYPELAEYIWGNRMGETFTATQGGNPSGEASLTAPSQGMTLDFNEVATGRTQTARLYFKGSNLSGKLEISISGTDARYFSAEASLIDASLVNAPAGYWLNVSYTPNTLGEHSARLRIQDGGLVGSIGVELRGECLPVPTLTAPVAEAPADVTSDSYIARWIPADDEVVDYYIVTRTIFRNGSATTSTLLAEESSLLIEGFDQSDSESYSVQSVRLGFKSAPSNTVTVSHSSISTVESANRIIAETYPDGLVRLITDRPGRSITIYDSAGRDIAEIFLTETVTELTLIPGIYFINPENGDALVKIAVR